MTLLVELRRFFQITAPLAPGETVVVAFSGGVDSTALLWSLARLAPEAGFELAAAHLDHGLDAGSAERARGACRLALAAGVPFHVERRPIGSLRRRGESPEAAARRLRYRFLEETRERLGARWVATAHHRGDQAETVLLRLLFGSGLEGLAGIREVDGRIVRPLLAFPRSALRTAMESLRPAPGLAPLDDPTNRDLRVPRNRLRHLVLPALAAQGFAEGSGEEVEEVLARLAGAAGRARRAIERRLAASCPGVESAGLKPDRAGAAIHRADLERLPPELLPAALAMLHRRAGAPYPASRRARAELARQLAERPVGKAARPLGCDCGGGWRWEEHGAILRLSRSCQPPGDGAPAAADRFSYTLRVPDRRTLPAAGRRQGVRGGSPRRRGQGVGGGGDHRMNETSPLAIEPLFDAETLRGRVAELGQSLAAELPEDPLLLALLGGSLIFFADLVRAIERPVRYELIHADYSGSDVLRIQYPIPIELEGQSVVLVKDVVTSGVIESYLEQQLRERGAREVRIVALIDKPNERKTDLTVDYLAFSIERPGVLVGYGLKHDGRHGNLSHVGILPDEPGSPPPAEEP